MAMESVSLLASTVNNTAGALVSAAMDGFSRKGAQGGAGPPAEISSASGGPADWGKGLLFARKEWKVPCMDVIVRF